MRTRSEQALASLDKAVIDLGLVGNLNVSEYGLALQGILQAIEIVTAQIESEKTS